MGRILIIMVVIILVMATFLFLPEKNNEPSSREKTEDPEMTISSPHTPVNGTHSVKKTDHWVNDSIYIWDETRYNWVATGIYNENQSIPGWEIPREISQKEPINIKWEMLLDIAYRLKYFEKIQTETFSPVFGENIKALDGKEVIIEGFVIPFDEAGELLALSYNPYSSCFFCGNASPASVISLYMKDKNVLYDLDDFRQFKGTLFLNYNDPEEFYYVLKNVVQL